MAISKILNMKDCGGHFHGKHLKRSLDYVMNPEKTQDGRLVGAINCQVDSAFEQMKATKRKFGKVDKRQGYHIILSFKEDEVNPDMAFEITRRFVEEYLGKSYEAVYVVHDNTAHVHSHIVFNSVSFVDLKLEPLKVDSAYEKPYFTTIGMTDESCATVYGYASGEISKAAQEDTEEIEVVLADRDEVRRILKEENVAIMCAYMLMHFLKDEEPFAFLR